MSLAGRRVLVTGAAGHIGAQAATALMGLGATVAFVDQDAAQCREAAERATATARGRAEAHACDLLDEQATRYTVRAIVERFGGLDTVVHCAAFVGTTRYPGWAVPFEEQTVEAWDAAIRVNLTAAFVVIQEAASALKASQHASVCLVGSTYGVAGPDMRLYEGTQMANPAGYAASKGGVIQLARYLATLLAPAVRVNCVSPGGIFRQQPEAFVQRYIDRTPLKRMATEEDVIGAVAFLVSDAASYVTGQNLMVDGGWTAW